jgi:hypothetical protein
VAVLALGLAACSPSAPPSTSGPPPASATASAGPGATITAAPHDLTGEIRLRSSWHNTDPCTGFGELGQVERHRPVQILNGNGTRLGAGLLEGGEIVEDLYADDVQEMDCLYTFRVRDLEPAPTYELVLTDKRIRMYDAAELEGLDWHVVIVAGTECGPANVCESPPPELAP